MLLRLFAPFLPFVTEEAWSWWQDGSVHRAAWPSGDGEGTASAGLAGAERGDPAVLETAAAMLGQIRKAKSAAKVSMRAEAARVIVRGPDLDEPCAPARGTCGSREHRQALLRPHARRGADDRGHAGGRVGCARRRGSGPVGSRGIGRVFDGSFGSGPVDGPKRSTVRSPTSW